MPSRLADSASPYLRAHAANPVAWFPWGEEAFRVAAERDVPVMVSIGYSTCHWCHVMARESFSDPETAALLNAGFVSVKVDREEHPDVDAAYLAAASAFTQNLGWPLTVFTTPQGRPFFAGTYWPPAPRAPLPSFPQVLAAVREAWTERRDAVDETAAALVGALSETTGDAAEGLPTPEDLAGAAARIASFEDPVHGGFGASGPKFPTVPVLRFLQSRALAGAGEPIAERALAAMAASELHDAVEGGFFRYATQRDWSVPHYERMLTDNAGLLDVAVDAGRTDVARDVARFLIDVLQQPSGGFAAAQDSESWIDGERSEGGYYARDAEARARLEAPAIDAKIVTGWNGLAIGALARAGGRLHDDAMIAAAQRAADAVLEVNVGDDGRLIRASLDEIASSARAVLEDYGLLADGLLVLALATGEPAYAIRARELVDAALVGIPGDPVLDAHGVVAPPGADSDHPSGASALAGACLALWLLGAGEPYRDAAEGLVRAGAARALAEPVAFGALLRVAAGLVVEPRQVVVVARDPEDPLAARAQSLSADVTAIVTPAQAARFAAAGFELFDAKDVAADGSALAYDCRHFVCRLPVTDPAALAD